MKIKLWIAFSWLFLPLLAIAGPFRITDLSVSSTNGAAYLAWTTPTPPLGTTLISVDVRYDKSPIGTLNWTNHTRVPWLTDPGMPGTIQTNIVPSLTPNTTYYFAIKVQDSAGSWSIMSNLPHVLIGDSTYSVVLAWQASSDPIVAGYNVYYGGASGTYTNVVNAGNATMVIISGLTYGVTNYFAATTYAASGAESIFSDEVSYHYP